MSRQRSTIMYAKLEPRSLWALSTLFKAAYDLIASHPESGSLRYAYELGLPDLRSISLKQYPYLVFYRDHTGYVDVWRVLHAKLDIPHLMQEPDNH